MKRVAVIGNSGSGKSTTARAIATRTGLPLLELDSVFHQPHWAELDLETFRTRVADFVARDEWIVDGNYHGRVGDLIWARADTVVWLDLPRRLVMSRVVRRTIRRAVTRQELWNGNRERWQDLLRWDPERSIIRWSWTQHHPYRVRYARMTTDPLHADKKTVRLQSGEAVAAWLGSLSSC